MPHIGVPLDHDGGDSEEHGLVAAAAPDGSAEDLDEEEVRRRLRDLTEPPKINPSE